MKPYVKPLENGTFVVRDFRDQSVFRCFTIKEGQAFIDSGRADTDPWATPCPTRAALTYA